MRDDANHPDAVRWIANNNERLVTTDYVIDELLTLCKARGKAEVAFAAGNDLFAGQTCLVEYVGEADIAKAWHVFFTFRDKDWSFTDCVSRVVMERLDIKTACAFDEHFRQFGTVSVVP